MGSQSLLSGFCSKSIISPENPAFVSSSSSSSLSSLSFTHTSRRVSFKPRNLIASLSIGSKQLICRATVEKRTDDVTSEQKDSRSGTRRKKLAVFVSGGGSNFRSIHEACIRDSVNGDVAVLVTNKRDCGGAEYARSNDIPVILFPKLKDEPDGLSPSDLVSVLRKYEVDFILLAGYLKLIPAELVQAFPKAILNIHPSLLPAFGGRGYYGMKVHKAVIASGARYSGPTIHFVDEHYDTGRILAQRVVPVLAEDTAEDLAARVLREEHKLYVEVTAALCEERIIWRKDGVPLVRSKEDPTKHS